ncbi:hypothetical protein Rrhod_0439 [Rhodococcus rhodnii LMG 5362]|uniref:Uncharacterized protein n=1 Tax=Rhodococcus rhodnii LMG 5362 TaxID=1273125 RepID=R7WSG3_9NOCA|nr:hypothetical protein Rrhod_0439 [Rhodococcus rhodnii LMG 5362]
MASPISPDRPAAARRGGTFYPLPSSARSLAASVRARAALAGSHSPDRTSRIDEEDL